MRSRLVVTLAALASLGCVTLTGLVQPSSSGDAARQETVARFQALTADLNVPQQFLQDNPTRTGDEFDPNRYFEVLDHLSMQPGYTLDYVYQYDSLGGFPVLYARLEDQPPLDTFGDFPEGGPNGYLLHVQTDDTEEGYFQLAVLSVMGGEFYLYWHAGYFDAEVVADAARRDELIQTTEEFCGALDPAARGQARSLSVGPVVELGADQASVQVVVFSKWRGFLRRSFEFARAFPHEALSTENETLVEYRCNIVF